MIETKITIYPHVEVHPDRTGDAVRIIFTQRPRPAIAMTTDGREHVVEYPSCKPWRGPR